MNLLIYISSRKDESKFPPYHSLPYFT